VTKAQLIDRLATETGLTRLETKAVVDGLTVVIAERVAAGEPVELRGFGTFRPRELAPRAMPDPRTGKLVDLPRRTVPVFRPADTFRRAVEDTKRPR
jgi:nucleoid DNA-binding protein